MFNLKSIIIVFISIFTLILLGCSGQKSDSNTIKVGTIAGPETELMLIAKKVAKKQYNLNVEIIEFTDYALPNAALNDGNLNANAFQHKPFLNNEIKFKNYDLIIIGKTFVYPTAIYSNKIKSLKEIKKNDIVAIPNDASNEARALLLLAKAQLIQLKNTADINATPLDIISNPLNLQFKELDASQLPRVLSDVTIAVINTNYAVPSGLYPNKQGIFVEDKTSPYVNLIVSRKDKANDPQLKQLVAAFQSKEVLDKANELFDGQAVQGW
jgi:D-methionine transport system substrate-binding protein